MPDSTLRTSMSFFSSNSPISRESLNFERRKDDLVRDLRTLKTKALYPFWEEGGQNKEREEWKKEKT